MCFLSNISFKVVINSILKNDVFFLLAIIIPDFGDKHSEVKGILVVSKRQKISLKHEKRKL